MMQLVSEILLQNEIEKYESKSTHSKNEDLFYGLCQKELLLLRKLKIESIDVRGKIEDVCSRLERQSLYFMDKNEFEEMKEKAMRFDEISKICK